MERKILINEIVNFCIEYKLFKNRVIISEIKRNIESELNNVSFVEVLYNTIFIKAKERNTLKHHKIITLLMEIEKLRIKLENPDYVKNNEDVTHVS